MDEIKTIDKVFYKEIGKLIHKQREDANVSLRDLAKMTGLSRTTLDNYEMGKTKIKVETYNLICKSLGVTNKLKIEIKGE